MMQPFRVLYTLALPVVVAACQTAPVTGRKQFMIVPESQAIQASTEAYAQILAPIQKQGKLNDDPAMKARVDKITARLVAQAIKYRPETESWDWQVAVIDDPKTLNAWCMAGGKMAIYSGIITQLNLSDDEIAQVMGHEIAHALAKHTAERMSTAMASQAALQIGAMLLGTGSATSQMALQAAAAATTVGVRAAQQPAAGVRSGSHRHRAGRQGGLRSARRAKAVGKDAPGHRQQGPIRLPEHPSAEREAAGSARGARPADDAVLRRQVCAAGVPIQGGVTRALGCSEGRLYVLGTRRGPAV